MPSYYLICFDVQQMVSLNSKFEKVYYSEYRVPSIDICV